jgi:LDH2 family malate/lactate/ureidoglycolate dehydrogenase
VSASAAARVTPAELRELVARVLRAAGADDEAAELVAGSLVASDVRGVHSHGAIRVPDYVAAIGSGRIAPSARARVVADDGPTVRLHGASAFGQVAAAQLADAVAAGARAHGLCLGTLAGVAHVGRLGEYVERLADQGLIGLAWANCGDPGGNVAPFGGGTARLGTNPLAYALPAGSRAPIVADFSTSIVAEGKVRLYKHAGRTLPEGWIIDADGAPSTNPQDLYEGGALLPMGGHKGFALGLLVEILGGVLAGAGCASLGDSPGNGLVLLAIDPERGASGEGFGAHVAAVAEALAATPPAAGGAGVTLPGEPELAAVERAEREGLELPAGTWQEIAAAARSLGVHLDT